MALSKAAIQLFSRPVDGSSARLRGETVAGAIQGPFAGKTNLAFFSPFMIATPPLSSRVVGLGLAIESLNTPNDKVDCVISCHEAHPFNVRAAMTWSRLGTPII